MVALRKVGQSLTGRALERKPFSCDFYSFTRCCSNLEIFCLTFFIVVFKCCNLSSHFQLCNIL